MTEPVVIGLGGNIGDEAAIIERFRRARDALAMLGDVRSAPLFRSAAWSPAGGWGGADQAPFLNTAVRVRVDDLEPGELIATVLEIELLLGRDRGSETRWGPRPIDLDVLVWGARVVRTPELDVPHPRLAERRFALEPLVALVGADFVVPGAGPAGELLARAMDQACEQISEAW